MMAPAKVNSWMDSIPAPPRPELIKQIKGASSFTSDPWKDVGQQPILKVWRITKFRAVPWPKEEYGTFYDADVYIILNSRYKDVMSSKFHHDVHLWLGKQAHQDEVHAGIKKALQLDECLQNEALLHRQVSGRENNAFRQYFELITVYRGNATSSYRYSPDEIHSARLLKYYKPSRRSENYRVKEISPFISNLQPEYNYILDVGHQIYLWTGNLITGDEKGNAVKYCENLVAMRGKKVKLQVVDEDDSDDHYFRFYLQNSIENLVDSDDETTSSVTRQATLNRRGSSNIRAYKFDMNNGDLDFTSLTEKNSRLKKQDLINQQGICIVDTGLDCFIWLGKKPQPLDRRNSIFISHVYLHRTSHPFIPVTVLRENQTCPAFTRALSSP